MFTAKQIAHIARESKSCCHHGHGMSVFRDGSTYFAISYNDITARSVRGDDGDTWESRFFYVENKMTCDQVRELSAEYFAMDREFSRQ